jgi:CheY-like chemotaxis protein
LSAPRVLVVEDELDIRELLEELLRLDGCSVSSVANGCEALTLLGGASELPDAIILDLMMPVMNGYEVLEALGREPRLAGIPVAVVSGAASQPKVVGVGAYLRKPMDFDEIRRFVHRSRKECSEREGEAAR